uniref:NADH-ubiquinone oxidoreductase chain 4 n=1 Tax=Aleurodicus dugesii TaxID=30099 RepID=Q6JCT9_ALEDU|nr:NADH dehydrogenase subunit 4 [Aleurodicus dugesii]AAS77750.1 NADH dehydrogenase subunit 4 [Aleurodicus dugesii]
MLKILLIFLIMMIMKNKIKNFMFIINILMLNFNLQNFYINKISYIFMSDNISFWITNMSIWILMIINLMENKFNFKNMIIFLTLFLIMTFNIWNFLIFYILFEISMFLIMIIMIIWGYQPERMEAILYMIFMTFIFSLPFFNSIIKESNLSLNFFFMKNNNMFIMISFMLIFMIKIPFYFIHIWLPKAHVESPVFGSMILAAIMLKLGSYGIMRMFNMLINLNKIKIIIISMSLWSIIILSMNCLIQNDIKLLIAYSSIVHMMILMTNIFMFKMKSMMSSMLIMIGHGLCSSVLFFISFIMYKNSKSRNILLNKGMINMMPNVMFFWFISCMNNVPAPPSINFMGEIMCMMNLISWSKLTIYFLIPINFFSSLYSIMLFTIPFNNKLSKNNIMTSNFSNNLNFIIMFLHLFPLMMLWFKMIIII